MNEFIDDLKETKLFSGIEVQDIDKLLHCLCTKYVRYVKGDTIIEEGNKIYDIGILLSGHGRAVKWDPSGRVVIITLLKKGSEIGVILAASLDHKSPVTVQAEDDVCVLQIPFERILTKCDQSCSCHDKLLRNYINIVAEKGLLLHDRIDCLLRPTVREKVMTYLLRISLEKQKKTFTIPMNRNAMAEYLNVERSALSRELSNMKKDGIIDYEKNCFRIC